MVSRRFPKIRRFLLAGLVFLLASCSADDTDPESQLRQTIDQIQLAAEQKKLGELMANVNESYLDDSGQDWKQVRAAVQFQFIRNQKIYTLKLIKSIEITDDEHAQAAVLVAMAGRPIDGISALTGLKADLIRFNLTFMNADGWKLTSARWQPAKPDDFF